MSKSKLKKVLGLLILNILIFNIFIMTNSNATTTEEMVKSSKPAKLSQEFLDWLKLSDKEKKKTIMPTIHELPENTEDVGNISGYDIMFEKTYAAVAKAIDTKYSLKDDIELRVKNQRDTSECWAFSFTSVIESTITKLTGKMSDEYSPRHIDYSCTRDFLNNQVNEYGFDRDTGAGGTYLNAISYLAGGHGPVLEKDMPFVNNDTNKINISEIKNKEVQKHIEGATIFKPIYKKIDTIGNISYYSNPAKTSKVDNSKVTELRNKIKQHVKQYGGVYTITTGNLNTSNYNQSKYSLYSKDESDSTMMHAMTIVGWDDEYSQDNFINRPATKGAYICLNSYGTDTYDNKGYIYVSYCDLFVETNLAGITNINDKDFDSVYQYDELGYSSYVGYTNDHVYTYNSYKRNDKSKKEYLSEVGTYIIDNTDVEIYVDPTGTISNCAKMKKVDIANQNAGLEYGYRVLKFKTPIEITGDNFKVVIKYIGRTGNYTYVPGETPIEGTSYEKAKLAHSSYVSSDGVTWQSFKSSSKEYDATIKAFTYYEKVKLPTSITISKESSTLDLTTDSTINLATKVLPSDAINTITWSSSNTSVATVDKNGKVTAKGNGTTVISAKTKNNLTANCTVTVITTPERITLNKSNITLYLDGTKTYNLVATISPSTANNKNKITWSSSNEDIAKVSSSGLVTAIKEGKSTITVKTENEKNTSVVVTVKEAQILSSKDSIYEIDEGNKFIKYVEPGTTYSEFTKNMISEKEYKIYDTTDKEVINGNMKSGYKLKILSTNETYLISVRYDANGDGEFNLVDIARMRVHYVGKKGYVLDKIYECSLDVNKDGVFNLVDIARIRVDYVNRK